MAAAYPVAADVLARLSWRGVVTPEVAAEVDAALAAAKADFERRANRIPLLAPPGDVTRQLDPPTGPGNVLMLDRDLASLTSVAYQPQGGSSTTLTSTQYLAEPVNATADGRPYDRITFSYQNWLAPLWYPQRGAIYVTGRWGYATTVPDDAWAALVAGACAQLFPGMRAAGAVAPNSLSRTAGEAAGGGVQLSWGNPSADQVEKWEKQYEQAIRNYRRITV